MKTILISALSLCLFVSHVPVGMCETRESISSPEFLKQNADPLPRLVDENYDMALNPFYQKIIEDPKGVNLEKYKIMYLLEELTRSPHQFERNGQIYPAARAASHLRMKYAFVKNRVGTAEEFIEHIASKSSTSGQLYRVILANGLTVPSGVIFKNELEYLNQKMKQE